MRKKLNITEGIFPMPVLMVATYNEDGSINLDADLSSRDGSSTPVFAEAGEYTMEYTIDGYPSVTGTVTK